MEYSSSVEWRVRTLPWDGEAADWHANIRHQLLCTGQPIGELDMMIAAHPLSAGAVLVTNKLPRYKRIDAPFDTGGLGGEARPGRRGCESITNVEISYTRTLLFAQ